MPSICCRHNKNLVAVLGSRVNCQRRNYLPNDVHEVDAKERKKKNDDEKEGIGKEKARRVISIFSLYLGCLVVSICRFDQFALASWKGRPRKSASSVPVSTRPRPCHAGRKRFKRGDETRRTAGSLVWPGLVRSVGEGPLPRSGRAERV